MSTAMQILKRIRGISFVNVFVRRCLRHAGRIFSGIQKRWPVAGVIELNFDGIAFKYYTSGDDGIVDQFYYNRPYQEYNDLVLFSRLAKASSVIIDIGANTGLYSIVSARVNPLARIFSFEPHPKNNERLTKNINVNNLQNISAIQVALGNVNSEIDFYIPASNDIADSSSALKEFSESTYQGSINWRPIKVKQITLNEFLENNNIEQVDLIKIDVEGYEMQVFEGGSRLFKNSSPIIIIEIFLDEERRRFFDQFIQQFDYTAYAILNDGLLRLDNGMTVNYSGLNYLFSKKRLSEVFSYFRNIETILMELSSKQKL